MSEIQKAYLAGLIDGEGYVGITRARTSKAAKGCKRGYEVRWEAGVKRCRVGYAGEKVGTSEGTELWLRQ